MTNRLFLVPGVGNRYYSIPEKIPEEYKEGIKHLLLHVLGIVGERRALSITKSAKRKYDAWYLKLRQERSIHARRLDTYALRLALLICVNDFKREIDDETIEKAIALADWQLSVRRQYDPINAETKVAEMEERIRRRLRIKPHTARELRQYCQADKAGLQIFRWALDNLKREQEIVPDDKSKRWKLYEVRD